MKNPTADGAISMRASTAALADAGLDERDSDLAGRALDVLDGNWIGHATKPSPHLYPHQWSWDSACHSIGYARLDQERAERELVSLFRGQWRNGLLPHIVFTDGAQYFPGPEFWQTERSPDAPQAPRTSGIVQPPIHATAALHVLRHGRDGERATAFARDLLPKLAAWHEYIYRERTRDGDGLAEVWHPWETGMDNSPLWDGPLERIALRPDEVPEYRRVDTQLAEASERPTNEHYDRYAYLVGLFREHGYRSDEIRDASPFVVQAVIFNSLLVQGNRDLAELARALGEDGRRYDEWADLTAAAMNRRLWDERHALYADHDVRSGDLMLTRTAGGFTPLYAGVPSPERAEQMMARIAELGVALDTDEWALTSLSPDDPRYDPTLYWRGPIWPVMNWFLYRGLVRYGYLDLARRVRATLVELPRRSGFWEHYSPEDGSGHGGEHFSWTAALLLDALFDTSSTLPVAPRPDPQRRS
jgi:glycogen debranching enzyme